MNRIYKTEYRKKLSDRINDINDNKIYFKLFSILKDKKDFSYTRNKNGIFFDMNKLNDQTIEDIKNFIDNSNIDYTETEKLEYIQYSTDDIRYKDDRLNNNEKNLLRHYNYNK